MIILNCNKFRVGAESVREMFIQLCDAKLVELQKYKNLGLMQMLDKYSVEDLKRAFRSVKVDKYNNLFAATESPSEFILRLLEYGGESVRPTHLISLVKSDLYKLSL